MRDRPGLPALPCGRAGVGDVLEGFKNRGAVSARFAVGAADACLLMIAGEFDLSIGSMIGFSGIVIALASKTLGRPGGGER